MQLTQLAGIIRGHPSLKDLTIKANEIRSSIYRKLLWALWNLERVAIKATIATHNEADKSDEVRKSEEAERELDAWIADNRPKRSTPTTKEHRIGDEPRLLFTLKEFHIHTGYHDMDFGMSFQFLRRCPDLKRFRPPRIDSEDLLQSIMAAIPETWPNLEHLDMGNFSPNRSSGDEHDAWLLAACSSSMRHTGGVKSIVLAPARFSRLQTAQTIYIRYAYTLVDLNLIGCSSFEGHLLQKVLTTCHKLQSLVALTETLNHPPPFMWKIGNVKDDPILESANLEYAANWVCLGLKTLRIQFCSMDMSCGEYRSNRAGIPKALIWQIERLMNLRDLRLCLDPPTWKDSGFKEGDPELRWWFDTVKVWGRENLQSALTVFGGLWHLRTLELRNLRDYIDISSLEDAKSSWENLKWVHYS
ncbi:hypothetical protein BGZ92_008551 [Podila epicladia]|nr:hypothetical protein BGZ92_008551 [Podila epicladia]